MKFILFKRSLEEGAKPVYLFDGEEEYFKERGEAMLRENGSLREKIARLEGDLARTPSLFDEHHSTRLSEESASHSDV